MSEKKILLRYGELFLKGRNKFLFENKLRENIRKKTGIKVGKLQSRLIMDFFPEHNLLKKVFGLISYSVVLEVRTDLEEIKKNCLDLMKGKKGEFRVETKRSDKNFPLTSQELNREAGMYIEKNSALQFKINAKQKVYIEINQKRIFIFDNIITCLGGLPVGVEGKVLLLIENEKSLLAGLLMMKRGAYILPVAFKEVEINKLQEYSSETLKLKRVHSVFELEEYAHTEGIEVIATSNTLNENFKSSLLELKPLVGQNVEAKQKFCLS